MDFFEKLTNAIERNQSLLCVGLDPRLDALPTHYRTDEENQIADLLAWNLAVIQQTADLVCAFKPNIAFYEALGQAGMALLHDTLSAIPDHIPVILDAKRGDIGSTATAYAQACFDQLGVDAVTLSPYLGRDSIDPFAAYDGKGLFVLCHTSNPSAEEFQKLDVQREAGTEALYLQVARTATRWSPQVGLVVGATYPEAVAAVRAVAADAWFLVPGIGAQGGDLAATLAAGLRADGSGLIVNVTRGVTAAEDPRAAAQTLRQAIADARATAAPTLDERAPAAELRTLIVELARLGAVKFGDFTLASGTQSPIYIDLRLLVGRPSLLRRAAQAYADLLAKIPCDRVAGVPYAALPIGTAVALATGVPLIYPRKEAKAHGLGKTIEGGWQPGERVTIIEDLITSGGSTIQTAERLRQAGLKVEDVIVLIDREQGGVENLARAGIRAHSVFKLSDMMDVLVAAQALSEEKRQEVLAFIAENQVAV